MQIEEYFSGNNNSVNQLIKNSFDMIVLLDAQGVQHYVSESCEKILGYKQEELIGLSIIDNKIHPEDQKTTKIDFIKILKNKTNAGTQYRHLHKNGSWVYLEANGTNQLENPAIKSIVVNVRDITNQKIGEQIIKENEQHLKELNATKDKLFSIIAHDLRSPFNSILGFSELLIQNTNEYDAEKSKKYLEIINSSVKNTLILLDNLLHWAKTQTGKISYNPKRTNLAPIINEIFGIFNSISKNKNISITYIPTGEIEIYSDLNMLKVVLRNLISNAIKFTNINGKIEIIAKQNKDLTEITISDNGIGMDCETISKLFKIDPTVITNGTANEKGSGLGLILCKEFIEKQNGKIWAESEVGKGSDFKFTLPLNDTTKTETDK